MGIFQINLKPHIRKAILLRFGFGVMINTTFLLLFLFLCRKSTYAVLFFLNILKAYSQFLFLFVSI